MSIIYGNMVGGGGVLGKSVIIKGTDGTELVGVVTDKETVLTATPNDIRKGKIAGTENGIIEGEKEIPAYETTAGTQLIMAGKKFSIPLSLRNKYDYTKLQCVIVAQNTNTTDSVATEKVVINDVVYAVNSTEKLADVTKNAITKSIDLNITNDTDKKYYIRYFTYREEE